MKFIKRLLLIIAIILALLFIGISVYIHFYGKNHMEAALTRALEKQVTFDQVSYSFPFGLKAQNIQIAQSMEGGKYFAAKNIIAHLSPSVVYRGQLIFDSVTLTRPHVVIEILNDAKDPSENPDRRYGVVVPPKKPEPEKKANIQSPEKRHKEIQSKVSIKQLVLKQGQVQYKNTSIDKDFSVTLEDVYLKADQLMFPFMPGRTNFNGTGRLVKEGNPLSGSLVEGYGWVDIVNRDMQAIVEVVEADGSVGMTAQAISKNNDMSVTGEVKFQNILMGVKKEEPSEASAVNTLISNALSSAGVEIGAKFSFNTKMDDFRPEKVSFSGNVVTK